MRRKSSIIVKKRLIDRTETNLEMIIKKKHVNIKQLLVAHDAGSFKLIITV
jgi:hypothetical protein